LFKIPPIN